MQQQVSQQRGWWIGGAIVGATLFGTMAIWQASGTPAMDTAAMSVVAAWHTPVLTAVMKAVTFLGDTPFLTALCLGLLVLLASARERGAVCRERRADSGVEQSVESAVCASASGGGAAIGGSERFQLSQWARDGLHRDLRFFDLSGVGHPLAAPLQGGADRSVGAVDRRHCVQPCVFTGALSQRCAGGCGCIGVVVVAGDSGVQRRGAGVAIAPRSQNRISKPSAVRYLPGGAFDVSRIICRRRRGIRRYPPHPTGASPRPRCGSRPPPANRRWLCGSPAPTRR